MDDAEFNKLRPFVPEYIHQPGIDSIISPGAVIQMDNVQSFCNPSRYSMLTGLYPHNHGATDNATAVDSQFILLTQVMAAHDYHVAIDGKFTNTTDTISPEGIEKWWITLKAKYANAIFYDSSGLQNPLADNTTQVIHDTAANWLANLQHPFFLWIGEILPHRKPLPTLFNKNLYAGQPIPLPVNFTPFTEQYPSFLYYPGAKFYEYTDSDALKESTQLNYECINDLSDFLLKAVDILRTRGLLENTFIVIVGDNGFMNGEHMLYGKNTPYNEAMRIPCFIRYAPWFSPGTVVDYTGFQSIDFAATILDAAGIEDSAFNSQSIGKSLRYLMMPGHARQIQYFEKIKRAPEILDDDVDIDSLSPSFRSVRTISYKYTRYQCDSVTEELFDLLSDPMESTNQAKNPLYTSIISEYRDKLDSMRIALNDTISGDTILRHCQLISTIATGSQVNSPTSLSVFISPNPASNTIRLIIIKPMDEENEVHIKIFNSIGVPVFSKTFSASTLLETNILTAAFMLSLIHI